MVFHDDLVSFGMGIMETMKNNKGPVGIAAVVGIGVLGWLAFGFFGIQAAFIDDVVDEGGPVFAAPAVVEEDADTSGEVVEPEAVEADVAGESETAAAAADAGGDAGPDASAAAAIEEATTEDAPEGVALVEEPEPEEEVVAEPAEPAVAEEAPAEEAPAAEAPAEETVEAAPVQEPVAEVPAPEPPVEETPVEEPPVEEAPAEEQNQPGEIVTLSSGTFSSLPGYTTSGDALVLNNGTEQRFLRFENFATDNGPDLKVYLRAANGDFVSLGDLSGNIGDQNYEIPVGVDLSVFSSVEIWCERFARGFGVATLS